MTIIRDDKLKDALHELDFNLVHAVSKGLREYASQFTGKECVDVMLSISDAAIFFHFEFLEKVFIVQGVSLYKFKQAQNNLLIVEGVLRHVKDKVQERS